MPKKEFVWVKREKRVLHRPPEAFWGMRDDEGLWYETPEEVTRRLALGARKAFLLQWVRRVMGRRLNRWERHCLRQHYFRDLPVTVIARRARRTPSAVRRTLERGLRKLRQAACDDPSWRI